MITFYFIISVFVMWFHTTLGDLRLYFRVLLWNSVAGLVISSSSSSSVGVVILFLLSLSILSASFKLSSLLWLFVWRWRLRAAVLVSPNWVAVGLGGAVSLPFVFSGAFFPPVYSLVYLVCFSGTGVYDIADYCPH